MRTVKKKSWNPIRTMRLIIFSQPSVFVRADLRAHSFGFILTSPGLVRLVLFGSNPPCRKKKTSWDFLGIAPQKPKELQHGGAPVVHL